jgi:hypothetical protein
MYNASLGTNGAETLPTVAPTPKTAKPSWFRQNWQYLAVGGGTAAVYTLGLLFGIAIARRKRLGALGDAERKLAYHLQDFGTDLTWAKQSLELCASGGAEAHCRRARGFLKGALDEIKQVEWHRKQGEST